MRRSDDDFADEIHSHLAHEADRLIRSGVAPADAYRRARTRFGNVTIHQEIHYNSKPSRAAARRFTLLLRRLRRTPGFSGTLVVLLGLTFTALTLAACAIVATKFQRVAGGHPGALVNLWTLDPATSGNAQDLVPGDVLALWRNEHRSLTNIAASHERPLHAIAPSTTIYDAKVVDGEYFKTLELVVAIGRGIGPTDDVPGAAPVAVLTDAIWRSAFASSAAIIGTQWSVAEGKYTIVGVLRPEATALAGAAMVSDPGGFATISQGSYEVIGRLKSGATIEAATAELSTLTARAAAVAGGTLQHGALLTSFSDGLHRISSIAKLFVAAVVVLSIVALINIGTFFLVHALGATRRMAITMALGASAQTLLAEAAIEGAVLGMAGGMLAVAGMSVGRVVLQNFVSSTITGRTELLPYSPIGAVTTVFAATIISALVATTAHTAVRRIELARFLHGAGAGSMPAQTRWRAILVAVQVALAFIAAITATRLIASVRYTSTLPVGYETNHLVVAQLPVWGTPNGTDAAVVRLAASIDATSAATPGLGESAAWSTLGFHMAKSAVDYSMVVEGSDLKIGATHCNWTTCPFTIHPLTDNAFRIIGIPLIAGRGFGTADRSGDPVAIINAQGAKAWFAGSNPIGRRIQLRGADDGERWRTVVGVVGDAKPFNEMARQSSLFRETPVAPAMIYIPLAQARLAHAGEGLGFPLFVGVRPRVPVDAAVRSLRALVTAALPDIDRPIVSTMEGVLARGAIEGGTRTNALVTAAVALITLVLVIGGIAGAAAESVRSRTREIGIRLALGSSRVGVTRIVVARIAVILGAGLAGGAATWLATRSMTQQLLFGRIAPNVPHGFLLRGPDTTAIAVIVSFAGIMLIGLVAALLPATSAARLDPAVVLRSDS